MKPHPKILIVGQGLAGTLIANLLTQRNIDYHVIDNNHKSASTKIAAGLINPITGRRYIKSWIIDDLLPEAIRQYEYFEKLLGVKLVYQRNILRTLRSPKQINLWNDASARPGYDGYIESSPNGESYERLTKNKCKFAEVKKSYQINIALLIELFQNWLVQNERLTIDKFDYDKLEVTENTVLYNDRAYDYVFFCQGHVALDNPYFGKNGFQLAKGEALMLAFDDFKAQKILRDEIFFAPNHNNEFWCGGGYLWTFDNEQPTESWKEEWLSKIEHITDLKFKIVEHKAGIRPCVLDRKPMIGKHPKYARLVLFNGLGTKGTSLGPYFANHLLSHIFDNADLMPEVNWQRYLK